MLQELILRTPAQDLTLDEWQKTIDINLTAPFSSKSACGQIYEKK